MWPFKKRDPLQQLEKDLDNLMKLYEEIIRGAVASAGKVDHAVCRRFVDQYLVCRRRHGEHFLDFVRTTFVPSWKEDADKRMESLQRMFMLFAESYLAALLSGTRECPEINEVFEYLSAVAKQAREARQK